jgi:ComEC/Rec2-related protein
MIHLWKQSPLVIFLVAFASGIVFAESLGLSRNNIILPACCLVFSAVFSFYLAAKNLSVIFAILSVSAAGAFAWSAHSCGYVSPSGSQEWVAVIVSQPRETQKAYFASIELLDGNKFTGVKADAIFLYKKQIPEKGNIIRFNAELIRIVPDKENAFTTRKYRDNVKHKAFIKKFDIALPDESAINNPKQKISHWLDSNTFIVNKGLIAGICFGDKSNIPADAAENFRKAGFMHLLAVSGMHVGIVAAVSKILFSFILSRSLRRKLLSNLAAAAVTWLYAWLADFSPSAVRACAMFTLYFIASSAQKETSAYNILAAAGILILAVWPAGIYNVGLQLSMAAMVGIFGVMRLCSGWLQSKTWIFKFFAGAIAVGVGAQLGTLPLSLYYFGYYPTYSLFFGAIAGLMVFAIIPLFFVSIVFGSAIGSSWPSFALNLCSDTLLWLAEFSSGLPYSTVSLKICSVQAVFLGFVITILILSAEMYLYRRRMRAMGY